jgi:hypothetical protein
MWVQIAIIIISMVISYAMRPKATNPPPTALKDIDFPQADEGTPQAVIFGDCWTSDWTVLAVGNYRTDPITATQAQKF